MFALNVFGPALKYRLDLLKYSSYDIRHLLVILTDKISYEKFYKEFHDDYTFIFVEDYMSKYPLSLKHELIPNVFESEEEHFTKLNEFYQSKNSWYSYDLHRFVFPYFLEKGIKKFVILDSDIILKNDINLINKFFNDFPEKSLFGPSMGTEHSLDVKNLFWQQIDFELNNNKIQLDTNNNHIISYDGWVRGFNFETIEDGYKFFDLWNTSYLYLLENRDKGIIQLYKNGEGPPIWSNEWIYSNIVYFFKKYLSYKLNYDIAVQPGLLYVPKTGNNFDFLFAKHAPRPEDNLYHKLEKYVDENGLERYPSRGAWYDFRFDYDVKKTTSDFIKKNKEELIRYYQSCYFKVEATDTHIYTKL
jgi:hypothetical protein